MPSFDIVSEVDAQSVDNAVNSARKEIITRYDFRGTDSEIELDKKNLRITLITDSDFRIDQIETVLLNRFVKAKIDPQSLDLSKEPYQSGKTVRKDIPVKQGIEREVAKKIIKAIKDAKIKVEPQIMDEKIRVSSKSINNLQAAIAVCRKGDFGVPLQFENMK
jgi:uncharacterized protein YajQ (UPF0234 family)